MSFKETRHGDGVADNAVAMLTSPNNIMTSRSLNTYYDVTQSQCMNGFGIFITKLKSPKGDSQLNSSQWGVYDNDHSHMPQTAS